MNNNTHNINIPNNNNAITEKGWVLWAKFSMEYLHLFTSSHTYAGMFTLHTYVQLQWRSKYFFQFGWLCMYVSMYVCIGRGDEQVVGGCGWIISI